MAVSMMFKVPGFAYPGGKVRLRKWLVSMMPRKGRRFVDLFAGRGNVFWLAACALQFREWQLNDMWTNTWFDVIARIDLGSIPIRLPMSESVEWRRRADRARKGNADDIAVAMESITMFSGGVSGNGSSPRRTSKYSVKAFRRTIECARRILRTKSAVVTGLPWERVGIDTL
ncbi:MAG TPA: DNA adenine methylase, partial [Planctomycetota bacterium]|nr:DNA adenine methylase [Planctomycetota bacterium]